MNHFEILTEPSSIAALQHLLGIEITEIQVKQNITKNECPLPLKYPECETSHDKNGFYISNELSCNQWLFSYGEQYLCIRTDWGDLADLYWRDFYTRECEILPQSAITESTTFIQFADDFILDKIVEIELLAYQIMEDKGYLLCDCAIKLIAENGQTILIANDTNILGSSRIIMQSQYQQQFIELFSAFPRLKITQNGMENYLIPSLETHQWSGYRS